jgi:hypothetical protein
MSFRHAWRLHFSLTFRSIQTSEQLATTVSLYPPPHLTIRCRHRLGTASTSGLQRPCEGQAFMRHFSKLLLLAQRFSSVACTEAYDEPANAFSGHGNVSRTRWYHKARARPGSTGLGIFSANGCHRRVPSCGALRKFPSTRQGHQCPWISGSPGALI